MKITISKASLASALSAVSSVVAPRNSLPILQFAKFETAAAGFDSAITATDLDCTYQKICNPSVIPEVGSCLLPVARVKEWLGIVSNGDVTLEHDGKLLKLSTPGSGTIKFSTYPVEEFPPMPKKDAKLIAEADFAPLKHIAWSMMEANNSRPMLEAAFIEPETDGLICVTTDGRKVGMVRIKAALGGENPSPLALPSKYVNLVAGFDKCELAESPNNLHFIGDSFHLIVRKSTEGIPPWRRSISNEQFPVIGSITVMRDEFAEAIAQCHVHRGNELGSEYGVRVRIGHDGHGGIMVACEVDKTGDSFFTVIEGRIKGQVPDIVLSTEHLTPFLALPDESPLKVEFTGSRTMVHMNAPDLGVDYYFAPLFAKEEKT